MTAVMEDKDVYLSSFARLEKHWKETDPPWLAKIRQSAIDRFAALGFPSLDDEEWRFTNLAPLTRVAFELARTAPAVVSFDGDCWPEGLILGSLAAALAEHPDLVTPHLTRLANSDEHAFTALNTAFLLDGAFVYLPRNCVLQTPIVIDFPHPADNQPRVWHRRCLVVAEANCQARIVERYAAEQDTTYFTNAVTEVVLGEGALIDYYKVQDESRKAFHIHTLQVQQGSSSNFSSHSITLGGALVRNDINAVLDAEGCECTLNGLYLGSGNQLIDNHTQIDHAKPHCTSHELYKGILDGHAKGVFNGKIHVHPDAQKTDAKQTNQTLLLSEDATINTKPQLEIYADDVKCTHGATVGQLDAEALFYLRSRGIGKDDARGLLTYAFANDIIGRIKIEALRDELEKLISGRAEVKDTV
jgi:Fe-S cluster assembly protein SufD